MLLKSNFNKKILIKIMRKFLKFALNSQKKYITIIIILTLIQTILQLSIFQYVNVSLNLVKTADIASIMVNGKIMVIITFLLMVTLSINVFLINKVTSEIAFNTREKIFHILTRLPAKELNKFKHSGLIAKSIRGVFTEQRFIMLLLKNLIPVPFVTIGVIIEISLLYRDFAIAFTLFIIISAILIRYKMKKVTELYFEVKNTYTTLNYSFREKILSARTLKIFQKQDYEKQKFKEACDKSYEKNTKYLLSQYYVPSVIMFSYNIIIVLLLIFILGDYQIYHILAFHDVKNGVMVIQYLIYFTATLSFIPSTIELWPKSFSTAVQIEEILDLEDKIYETENKVKKSDFNGIEFKNVCFTHENKEILKDISFEIPTKSTIAIVGGTSSGKTTLMHLLDRLYELKEGDILIDGYSINDCLSKEVRNKISYAMKKNLILNDTIYNNITMGDKSITEEDVIAACEKTGLEYFLKRENMDLNSKLYENGTNIVPDFRQKITLTRAIAHDRDIYIFDEQFYIVENKTNIILTKNIKKIKDIDSIIVLEKGKIVGKGSHQELLETCLAYQKLYSGGGYDVF